jgi:ribonucleoside-diphosphate reductase alpha chain
MSWTVDVLNPAGGDDFVLGLKELVLPDGQRRPYSVWLSGEYPRALDGL